MDKLKIQLEKVGIREVLHMMTSENLRALGEIEFRYYEGEGTKADIFVNSSGVYRYVFHRNTLYSVQEGYDEEFINLFIKG